MHACSEIDNGFAFVEHFLKGECGINALATVSLVLLAFWWLKHVFTDLYLSLNRIVVGISLLSILAFGGTFTNIHTIIRLDYLQIASMVLIVQMVIESGKLWNKRWGIQPTGKKRAIRYHTEQPQEGLDTKVREAYAKKVVNMLMNTDISRSSFAAGITSEWGSGKTSFLMDMKVALKDRCYMVDFKPWHCQTPDQIVNEFFELFRKEIKSVYSPLQKPLLRYAQLLNEIDAPKYLTPFTYFLPKMTHSIDEYKGKIESGLKQMDKPIVVTIDDLDRLAADELFEVMRLIRNTAAFPNLIYLVCYDKDYVVRMIEEKSISDGDHYLEKIFPLELPLPKIEDEALVETFRKSLIDMYFLNGKHDSLISRLSVEDEMMIVRLLPTFRKMKRFARLLVTNTMFAREKIGQNNVDLYDIFLIELLHFCRKDIYAILRDRPEYLVNTEKDENTKQAIYTLKDDVLNGNLVEKLTGVAPIPEVSRLLKQCFRKPKGERTRFMVFVDSYQNYFCMATPDANISKKEFEDLLTDRSQIRRIIHDWFWKISPKKSASLYSRMMTVRTKELAFEQWKDYLFVLYAWMCETDDVSVADAMTDYMQKENLRLDEEKVDIRMNEYAVSKLQAFINSQNVNRMNVAKVLSAYYGQIHDAHGTYIIDGDEIKKMLVTNYDRFMEEKNSDQDAINVIALNGNDLNTFVKAHCVMQEGTSLSADGLIVKENLIIDKVISYFSDYGVKSSHYADAKNMYEQGTGRYKPSWYVKDLDLDIEKEFVFGSDDSKYKLFLNACFVDRTRGKEAAL